VTIVRDYEKALRKEDELVIVTEAATEGRKMADEPKVDGVFPVPEVPVKKQKKHRRSKDADMHRLLRTLMKSNQKKRTSKGRSFRNEISPPPKEQAPEESDVMKQQESEASAAGHHRQDSSEKR
jgi:hypothetical protein